MTSPRQALGPFPYTVCPVLSANAEGVPPRNDRRHHLIQVVRLVAAIGHVFVEAVLVQGLRLADVVHILRDGLELNLQTLRKGELAHAKGRQGQTPGGAALDCENVRRARRPLVKVRHRQAQALEAIGAEGIERQFGVLPMPGVGL